MTRRICTEYIDPSSIEALVASRLIPLDKGEGAVRPIGVGGSCMKGNQQMREEDRQAGCDGSKWFTPVMCWSIFWS